MSIQRALIDIGVTIVSDQLINYFQGLSVNTKKVLRSVATGLITYTLQEWVAYFTKEVIKQIDQDNPNRNTIMRSLRYNTYLVRFFDVYISELITHGLMDMQFKWKQSLYQAIMNQLIMLPFILLGFDLFRENLYKNDIQIRQADDTYEDQNELQQAVDQSRQ